MTEAKKRYLAWLEATGTPLSTQVKKLKEEFEEVNEPLFDLSRPQMDTLQQDDPELAEHVAREATDVAVVAIAVIHLLGHDFEALYEETVAKIERKYPTERIKEMRATGMAVQAILSTLKDEWNQSQNSAPQEQEETPQQAPKSPVLFSGFPSSTLQPVPPLEPSKI